ncbi:SpoVR family protein [Alicyclobacillus macrosporangiidus]|uniref:SpoVR family protein n=1 Tax=Alicyclobacillus macrosporangiidus TaxID=392015 RepID=UPI000495F72E|nr:SpoVR family protein [Alicyclobacillus macrosporangiidus]
MKREEYARFERTIAWMESRARELGLDFFDMRYEICPADVVYTIAGFGMPTRYSHWSFGKQYHRHKLDYDLGLSRIYELVVNNDPCYAFFLENNTVLQNEMIVAHVLGHSDFFKNNARFRYTNRDMIDTMAATAERFRRYEEKYGVARVEEVIDAAMSIQEHVDPSMRARRRMMRPQADAEAGQAVGEAPVDAAGRRRGPYDDLWQIGSGTGPAGAGGSTGGDGGSLPRAGGVSGAPSVGGAGSVGGFGAVIGAGPNGGVGTGDGAASATEGGNLQEKDLLGFILENSRHLEDWERDIVAVVREEMLYFWPQLETKIMNEGWATFWHIELMREMDLSGQDAIDFAQLTANVTQPNRFSLNPYNVGLAIWRDIERRYGREKMFEVRECESDTSFLRNYLNQDIVDACELYLFERRGIEWVIVERNYEKIRDLLVQQRTNGGFPVLYVTDGDLGRMGGLCITHAYDGQELDVRYIERTLPRVHRLWGRPVTLRTVVDGRPAEFRCEGDHVLRRVV